MTEEGLRKADSRRSPTLGNFRDLFLQTIIEDHCHFVHEDDVLANEKRSASCFLPDSDGSNQPKNRLQYVSLCFSTILDPIV